MSLVLPLSFFSNYFSNAPPNIGGSIFKIITSSSPYLDYNFTFGSATQLNGSTLSGIGLLNTKDDIDPGFKPNIPNIDWSIRTAVLSSNLLGNFRFIVGGYFDTLGLSNTQNLALINLSSVGGQFSQSFTTSFPTDEVLDIATTSDKVFVVGDFSTVNPATVRKCIAAYNLNGTLSTTFNWGLDNFPTETLNCTTKDYLGNIYFGGKFTTITNFNGPTTYSRNNIVRIIPSGIGTISNTFNPSTIITSSMEVTHILTTFTDNEMVIVGTTGVIDKRLIRLPRTNPTTYESFDTVIGDQIPGVFEVIYVSALKIDNNGRLLACLSIQLEDSIVHRLYRFYNGFSIILDTDFGEGNGFITVDNHINSISVDNYNNIILGGSFNNVEGITRNYYAVLTNDGLLLNR